MNLEFSRRDYVSMTGIFFIPRSNSERAVNKDPKTFVLVLNIFELVRKRVVGDTL